MKLQPSCFLEVHHPLEVACRLVELRVEFMPRSIGSLIAKAVQDGHLLHHVERRALKVGQRRADGVFHERGKRVDSHIAPLRHLIAAGDIVIRPD